MSCCNFDGQGTLDKLNPETQRITEAIYSDWTEAAGGPMIPGRPDFGGRSLPKNFGDIPGMGNPNAKVTGGGPSNCCDNPDICDGGKTCNGCQCMMTTSVTDTDPTDDIGHRRTDPRPVTPDDLNSPKSLVGGDCSACKPCNANDEADGDCICTECDHPCQGAGYLCIPNTNVADGGAAKHVGFDGAAVKKNWVPLVVLGLSLVIGIGISEWASKKYIK